jgi:RNA polymerase sigma-70 factor (ECF subfamily)
VGQTDPQLGEAWLAGASPSEVPSASAQEIDATLRAAVAAARARHPDVRVSDEDLVLYARARVEGSDPPGPARLADFLLASGLDRGDPAALRIFDATVAPGILRSLEKLRIGRDRLEDVMQRLKEALFVGRERKIAQYRGEGELAGWLRVTATRLALRAERADRSVDRGDDFFERLPDRGADVELEVLRSKYAAVFRQAFRDAIASLGDRDRTLLRQHHADGMSIDALAPVHGVHRATVARWIAAAELSVLERTRARFRAELSASPAECESVMRLLRGELSVSLRWLAASSDRAG